MMPQHAQACCHMYCWVSKYTCARESKARARMFLERKLISDYGQIFPYESQPGAANGQKIPGAFAKVTWGFGRADAGTGADFQLKASTTVDLGTTEFLFHALSTFEKRGFG